MRYKDPVSFFRHLKDASPNHLCRCYLVIVPNAFERKKVLDKMLTFFSFKSLSIEKYDYSRPFQEKELSSPSFLGEESLVIIDDFSSKLVSKYFLEKLSWGIFFFACSSKKDLNGWDKKVEKEGVIFDLSLEKPWEKKGRLEKQLKYLANKQEIQISQEAIESLFIRLGMDPSLLEQEMNKLIMYAKEKKEITLQDVKEVSSVNYEISSWQIAEKIIWEEKSIPNTRFDSHLFFPLIGALRSQLQVGYRLSVLIDQKRSLQEIQTQFPKIWPKILEKKKSVAEKKGTLFFQKGLSSLYEIELLSKDKVQNYRVLIDYFNCKLHA